MIIHVDMDAFYASVEERENPELKGKPLIVGGEPDSRGVVSAANYEARKYGVHSAMPSSRAVRLCPDLLIIPPNGKLYAEVSQQIRLIFNRYTPIVEPLSLDEAFLDPSGSEKLHGSSVRIGHLIKNDIQSELNLVASVGIAANKFLAKLASDQGKPNGFFVVQSDEVQSFLDGMPMTRIWGVGKSAQSRLSRYGIETVADIRCRSQEFLEEIFGSYGQQLWRLVHGVDNRQVVPSSEAKSISQETTFSEDISDLNILESALINLTESVGFRLREEALQARTVTIKIRFDDFKTITRSRSLQEATDTTDGIWGLAQELLRNTLSSRRFSVRLIGVGVTNLGTKNSFQSDLFEQVNQNRKQRLDQLSDKIKKRYGKKGIQRGKSIR